MKRHLDGQPFSAWLGKAVLRRLGFRAMRASSLPRGLEPLGDLFDLPGFGASGVVVDVGANVGLTVAEYLRFARVRRVIACEPAPVALQTLSVRFRGEPRVELVEAAVGAEDGRALLELVEPKSGLNRLVAAPRDKPVLDVRLTTLETLAATHDIDEISLLKIDTEGGELNVLEGGRALFAQDRVEAVLAECTSFDRGAAGSFFGLHDWLTSFGFGFLGLYDVHHSGRGIHWCNGLWIRQADGRRGLR